MTSVTPRCNQTSAGIILLSPNKQSLFLQRRQKFPWGWASPAGRVDDGETYFRAAIRELKEETGLNAGDDIHLVLEADVDNQCRRPGGIWHRWRVYQTSASGLDIENKEEVQGAGWYLLSRVQELARQTEDFRAGLISEEAWQAEPGLEGIWYDSSLHADLSQLLPRNLVYCKTGKSVIFVQCLLNDELNARAPCIKVADARH
jgi:8-oxo-dGTP pyrophosphatase MutT (NUDIX family)